MLVELGVQVLKSLLESADLVSEKTKLVWGDTNNWWSWRLWKSWFISFFPSFVRELDSIDAFFLGTRRFALWNLSLKLNNMDLRSLLFWSLHDRCMMDWLWNILDGLNFLRIASSHRSSST